MHLKKLKQRIIEAKKQHKEGLISPYEQRFLVSLAQDKYYRATVADDFLDTCVEKYKTKILEAK